MANFYAHTPTSAGLAVSAMKVFSGMLGFLAVAFGVMYRRPEVPGARIQLRSGSVSQADSAGGWTNADPPEPIVALGFPDADPPEPIGALGSPVSGQRSMRPFSAGESCTTLALRAPPPNKIKVDRRARRATKDWSPFATQPARAPLRDGARSWLCRGRCIL